MADDVDVRKQLVPGVWYAGFHSPFFVTNSMVASAIEKFGFTNIKFFPRATQPPVDPKKDPKYDDAWETWLSAEYRGEPKPVSVPHFDHVDWLLHVDFPKGPELPPPLQVVVTAPPFDKRWLLALIAVWYLARR